MAEAALSRTRADSRSIARLASGLALALTVTAVWVAPALATDVTRITTVAGGGPTAPPAQGGSVVAATSAHFDQPHSVSLFEFDAPPEASLYTVDLTCVPLRVALEPGKDTGPISYVASDPKTVAQGCSTGAAPPAYPGPGIDPAAVDFADICCIRGWGTNQWMVANNPALASRVEWFSQSTGDVHTLAGSTGATGCADITSPPAPTSGTATSAKFCDIVALATTTYNSTFAIGEMRRQNNGNGNVYRVTGNIFPDNNYTVTHVSGAKPVAGLAFDNFGNILNADGVKIVWLADTSTAMAGDTTKGVGFSGDGGDAVFAQLNKPSAVSMMPDRSYVIADKDNCRIRRVSEATGSGQISTIGGNGCGGGGTFSGLATASYIGHPVDVAGTPRGVFLVSRDTGLIQLIDRTSIIESPKSGVDILGAPVLADATPSFTFASLDTPPRLRCTLDGGAPFNCPSPYTLDPATSDGNHTLKVWENGHDPEPPDLFFSSPPDPTPATFKFYVDTTGPAAFSLREPAAGATGLAPLPLFSWDETTDELAGVDHYELWIDGAKNRDVALDACSGGGCSAQPAGPLGEGDHSWQVRAVDRLDNAGASEIRNLNAGGAPIAVFTISPNPALAGRTVTFDASGSSDPSGIAHYEWDLDGDGALETDAGASPATTRSYPAPATVPITLRVTDGSGKASTATLSLRISSTPEAASLLGVTINNGAQFTKDPNVKLTVKAPASATSLLVSNDGGFLAPATFPVSTTVDWKLDSSGPERLPKTVYLRFLLGPIVSENYTDDIILDEIPPVVQSAALVPPRASRAAARAAKTKTYVVKVRARDTNSGVGKLQVTANKRKPGKLIAYKRSVKVKSAKKPKFARAQDRAGNFSAWKKLR